MTYYRNRTLAALLIIFNITVIVNTLLIQYYFNIRDSSDDEITAYAVRESTASFCLDNGQPRLNLTQGLYPAIITGQLDFSIEIDSPLGFTDYNVTFQYGITGGSFDIYGSDYYDGDYSFSIIFNSTDYSDTRCNSQLNIFGKSPSVVCSPFDDIFSGAFSINNLNEEPNWTNFMNQYSTNFTSLASWSNLTKVVVGNEHGKVYYGDFYKNYDGFNFDTNLEIGFASINVSGDTCFDSMLYHLQFNNITNSNPGLYFNGEICDTNACVNRSIVGTTYTAYVSRHGDYSIVSLTLGSNLDIFDDTDPERNSITKFALDGIRFYANYSDDNGTSINLSTANCYGLFNKTGTFTSPATMEYNQTSNLYEYTTNFTTKGNYTWNVICNDTSLSYQAVSAFDNVTVTNSPPELIDNISNIEWNEDNTVTGLDLDDYFSDQDGDNLSFSYSSISSITVVIASDNVVSFVPDTGFFGLRRIVFTANDSINTTNSNNITLIVNEVQDSSSTTTTSSSGGGGGGGGGGGARFTCYEEWFCKQWGVCVDGIRTRECFDLNNCGTFNDEPPAREQCTFNEACYNGIQDEGEEGVDCGGDCPDCFTCFDRQLNQDETDIDCGGISCKACREGQKCLFDRDCETEYCNPNKICSFPTCNDGFQNQDEKGVDCGGKCARKCPGEEIVGQFGFLTNGLLMFIVLVLISLLFANMYKRQLKQKVAYIYYRLLRPKSKVISKLHTSSAQYVLRRIAKLNSELTSKNPRSVFSRYFMIYNQFLMSTFGLKKGFSVQDLQRSANDSGLDRRIAKLVPLYYSNLIRYRSAKLQKDDVKTIMEYGSKLVRAISGKRK